MKVGTDGVLLGSWAGVDGSQSHILDIGSGTGLISLMLAQRSPLSVVLGVEIEPRAALEARGNVSRSDWSDRIKIEHISFQEFASRCEARYFDLVVSNPPYFNGTYKANGVERNAARHGDSLSSDELLDGVSRVLNPHSGRFAVIYPSEAGAAFIAKATLRGLFCNRICHVISKEGGSPKRILMEFSFSSTILDEHSLTITDRSGIYTDEYKALTSGFYLRF
ncbi:MAG: methyltransferase [Rikenellaceae bacterium]